jgi:hypothetical protein
VHISKTPLALDGSGDTIYEAESGRTSGQARQAGCPACSNGAKVGNIDSNSSVTVDTASIARAGGYVMTLGYTAADGRSVTASVNGAAPTTQALVSSGGWDTVATATIPVNLHAGTNTIKLGAPAGQWSPDLDRFALSRVYEAEDSANVLGGGAARVDCTACASGKAVRLPEGSSVRLPAVSATAEGSHRIRLDYVAQAAASVTLTAASGATETLDLPPSSANGNASQATAFLALPTGDGAITISLGGSEQVILDRILVTE